MSDTLWLKWLKTDNQACIKIEVFFKMESQYTIVLQPSDYTGRNLIQVGMKEGLQQKWERPFLFLRQFCPPGFYLLQFYSERNGRANAEDGGHCG